MDYTPRSWELAMESLLARAFTGPSGPHPPYVISKIKGKFYVKNSLGEKKNSKGYKTEAEAQALQKALYSALPPNMKK